jgi:hypothetical protein
MVKLDGVNETGAVSTNAEASSFYYIGILYNLNSPFDGDFSYFRFGLRAYNLNEKTETTAYDSSGNMDHGTRSGGVTHVIDNTAPTSRANADGFTVGTGSNGAAVGVIIPADASNPGFDVLANALDWEDNAFPRRPEYRGSVALVGDGIMYLSSVEIAGTETVASYAGTGPTPVISAGKIDFGVGTYSNLILSDGKTYPMTECAGDFVNEITAGVETTITSGTTDPPLSGTWGGELDGEENAQNAVKGFTMAKAIGSEDGTDVGSHTVGSNETWESEFRIKIDSFANYVTPLFLGAATGDGAGLLIYSDGKAEVVSKASGVGGADIGLVEGQVHSIICGYGGSDLYIQVDGGSFITAAHPDQSASVTDDLILGDSDLTGAPHTIYSAKFTINNIKVYDTDDDINFDMQQIGNLRIPASSADPTVDAYFGEALTNPPIANGNNGSETTLDYYKIAEDGGPCPETNHLSSFEVVTMDATNYSVGTTAPIDTVFISRPSDIKQHRGTAFAATLTGQDLIWANNYSNGERWNDSTNWDDDTFWNEAN